MPDYKLPWELEKHYIDTPDSKSKVASMLSSFQLTPPPAQNYEFKQMGR